MGKRQGGQFSHENIDIGGAIAKELAELDGAKARRAAQGVIADESLRDAEAGGNLPRIHQATVDVILFHGRDCCGRNDSASPLNPRRHGLETRAFFRANRAFLPPRLARCAVFLLRRLGPAALLRRFKQIWKKFIGIVTSERNGGHGPPHTPTCPKRAVRRTNCPIALIDPLIDFVYQCRPTDRKIQRKSLRNVRIILH